VIHNSPATHPRFFDPVPLLLAAPLGFIRPVSGWSFSCGRLFISFKRAQRWRLFKRPSRVCVSPARLERCASTANGRHRFHRSAQANVATLASAPTRIGALVNSRHPPLHSSTRHHIHLGAAALLLLLLQTVCRFSHGNWKRRIFIRRVERNKMLRCNFKVYDEMSSEYEQMCSRKVFK